MSPRETSKNGNMRIMFAHYSDLLYYGSPLDFNMYLIALFSRSLRRYHLTNRCRQSFGFLENHF